MLFDAHLMWFSWFSYFSYISAFPSNDTQSQQPIARLQPMINNLIEKFTTTNWNFVIQLNVSQIQRSFESKMCRWMKSLNLNLLLAWETHFSRFFLFIFLPKNFIHFTFQSKIAIWQCNRCFYCRSRYVFLCTLGSGFFPSQNAFRALVSYGKYT